MPSVFNTPQNWKGDELGVCGKVLGWLLWKGSGSALCCTQALPASFRMDPSQAKAEPISKVDDTSVYLKSREKLQSKIKSEKKGAPECWW